MPNGPLTNEQMLAGLYTEVLGMDGKGGMRQEVRDIHKEGKAGRAKLHRKVDYIRKHMMTKGECAALRQQNGQEADKNESRTRWRKEFSLKWVALFLGPAGLASLVFLIIKILEALKSYGAR